MKRFLRLLTSCLDTLFRRNPPANALRDRVTQLSEEAVAINSQQLANNETNGYRFLLYLEILDYARNIEILVRHGFQSNTPESQYAGEYAFFSEHVHRGLKVLENQFIVGSDGSWQFPPELENHWREPKVTPITKTAEWILGDAREQLTLSCMT